MKQSFINNLSTFLKVAFILLLYMEELLKNLFIHLTFPPKFDSRIWQTIAEEDSHKFQVKQRELHQLLLRDQCLKEKYLQIFERNHLKMYEWYLLAVRQKVEIKPYLFQPLLQKTPSFNHRRLNKDNHQYPRRQLRTQQNGIQKILSTDKQKQKLMIFQEEQISSHDLYMQTFAACRGQHYIPYDYSRHMKSCLDKTNYNSYIRQDHKRNHSSPIRAENTLSKFLQWQQIKEKTSILNFRSVFGNLGLNSQRGFNNLLKRKGSQKIVFVNHQRKPVSYYTQPLFSIQQT